MAARTVYIHAGLPKTGSSALQAAIGAGRDQLAAAGLRPWSAGSNHGLPLAVALGLDVGGLTGDFAQWLRYRLPPAEVLRRGLVDEIEATEDAFLLTGELIPEFGADGLARLRHLVTAGGAEARVVVYVREPRAWITSQAQQLVQVGFTLDEALEQTAQRIGGRALLPLAETFGREKVSVRLHRSEGSPQALLRDLLEAVGRAPALADEITMARDNQGLSHRAVLLWDAMNRRNRAQGLPPLSYFAVNEHLRRTVPGPPFQLPRPRLDAIVAEQAGAIAAASELAGVDLAGLPFEPRDDVDPAWQPDDDEVRTLHARLIDVTATRAREAYEEGNALLAGGDEAAAERCYISALDQVPTMPEALAAMARLRQHPDRRRSSSPAGSASGRDERRVGAEHLERLPAEHPRA